jgi:hypothetical protein
MRFAADYSETLQVFFYAGRSNKQLSLRFSVVCEMATFFKINMNTYLDMLQLYAVPQIGHLQPHIILQQDGAPPHWGLQIRACLDRTFPGRWIDKDGPMPWPPCSPDITSLDFYCGVMS